MTDKQRVEFAFIGRLVYLLVLGAVSIPHQKSARTLEDIALTIAEEPLRGLLQDDAKKLKRRVLRMEEKTIALELKDPAQPRRGAHGEKVVLCVFMFIEHLVQTGWLEMAEDSDLAQVMDFLLGLVDQSTEIFPKRYASADKTARKWLETLQRDGYYKEVAAWKSLSRTSA